MDLEVKKKKNGNKITLELNGMINTETVGPLNEAADELNLDDIDLTLDFSKLSYITSVGLRTLLRIRKKISEDRIRIIGMNQAVYDVFEMIRQAFDKINKRPRKCLGYRTPYEVYYSTELRLT